MITVTSNMALTGDIEFTIKWLMQTIAQIAAIPISSMFFNILFSSY